MTKAARTDFPAPNVVVPLVGQYGLWVSFFFARAFEFYYLIKIFKNISEEVNA